MLISQDGQQVECRRRTAIDSWETVQYDEGDRVTLTSLNLTFALADLYRGLDP